MAVAVEAGFDTRELEQLARDLQTVADRYPEKAKEFLRKQGNEGRDRLRQMTQMATQRKTGNLLKGINRSSVQEYRDDYQIRVRNRAPHAHLIEHGHVQWVPVPGKGGKGRRKTEQFVPGRHPAAYTVKSMKATMPDDAAEMVEALLKEGLGV